MVNPVVTDTPCMNLLPDSIEKKLPDLYLTFTYHKRLLEPWQRKLCGLINSQMLI